MGKSTISMAMFNSYVSLPEGKFGSFSNHLLQSLGPLEFNGFQWLGLRENLQNTHGFSP